MRYIGNKLNLLDFIYSIVEENKLPKSIVCDIFAGTTNVSKLFKEKGFTIISNDFMTFSYVFQMAYIKNNKKPSFSGLKGIIKSFDIVKVVNYLNKLEGKEGFIYNNFCSEGSKDKKFKRNYFSSKNAKKIDAIRDTIEEWFKKKLITKAEFYILLCSLLEAVPFVSNISGTYGAFLKINDPRMFKSLTLRVPSLVEGKTKNICYQQDGNELIRKIKCDILYVDPPYNSRQYAPNYHLLETIAIWDKKLLDSKTGLRPWSHQKSDYSYKNKAVGAFKDLIKNAKCKYILFSYNTEGLVPDNEIMKILLERGEVKVYTKEYRRYKSNSNGDKSKEQLKELLFFVKVKN